MQDVIDYTGEEPSTKHHPGWSIESPGVWRVISPGKSTTWAGDLRPGIHVVVCARLGPLGVWLGAGLTVEE